MDPTTHKFDACSWKLTGEENSSSTTPHVDAKVIVNSMISWGAHETRPYEHSTTRVHWGDHDLSLNPMDEYSISEVHWG